MKYLICVITSIFLFSCAKEDTNQISGVFGFTIAEVNIEKINENKEPPACMYLNYDNNTIEYSIKSQGQYGSSSDVDTIIRNSEIRISRARIYLDDKYIDIPNVPSVKYGETFTDNYTITIDNISFSEGSYNLSIEMVASEYDGNGKIIALNNTFSKDFGDVIITSNKDCNPY